MRDFVTIGSTPCGETCAQVGTPDYVERARAECRAFIAQLRRHLGEEPHSALLSVKSSPHELGTMIEVVCYFDSNDEQAMDYAYACESQGPEGWDAKARGEMQLDATRAA